MRAEPTLCIFRLRHPEAEQVFLVGTFNDWSTTATPMKPTEPGRWEASIRIPPGEHRYCYVALAHSQADDKSGRRCLRLELVNGATALRVPESEVAGCWN